MRRTTDGTSHTSGITYETALLGYVRTTRSREGFVIRWAAFVGYLEGKEGLPVRVHVLPLRPGC